MDLLTTTLTLDAAGNRYAQDLVTKTLLQPSVLSDELLYRLSIADDGSVHINVRGASDDLCGSATTPLIEFLSSTSSSSQSGTFGGGGVGSPSNRVAREPSLSTFSSASGLSPTTRAANTALLAYNRVAAQLRLMAACATSRHPEARAAIEQLAPLEALLHCLEEPMLPHLHRSALFDVIH